MESKSIKGSVVITGGTVDNSNVAAGTGIHQVHRGGSPSEVTTVLDALQRLRQSLAQETVPDQAGALLAVRELEEDAPEPSRHYRLPGALGRLKDAIGPAAAFAVPLTELAAAIAELIHAAS